MRILISTNPAPTEIPIIIKELRDVFINGLPVVSVCCVVRIDMDGCGAADFSGVFHVERLLVGELSSGFKWKSLVSITRVCNWKRICEQTVGNLF